MATKTKLPKTTNKDVNNLIKLADKQDWRFKPTKKHIMAYPPNRNMGLVLIPVTTDSGRSARTYQNVKTEMKKKGLIL
jgi:hypothetical protein